MSFQGKSDQFKILKLRAFFLLQIHQACTRAQALVRDSQAGHSQATDDRSWGGQAVVVSGRYGPGTLLSLILFLFLCLSLPSVHRIFMDSGNGRRQDRKELGYLFIQILLEELDILKSCFVWSHPFEAMEASDCSSSGPRGWDSWGERYEEGTHHK